MTRCGEYLELYWDSDPPYEVVRGHIPQAEFERVVQRETGIVGQSGPVIHRWARFVPVRRRLYDSLFVLEGSLQGRGAFAVTIGYVS